MENSKYAQKNPFPVAKMLTDGFGRPKPVYKTGRRGIFKSKDIDTREYLYPQAENIIRKFGSPYRLAAAIKNAFSDPKDHIHVTTIYKWAYPRSAGGLGGHIPDKALKKVLRAARIEGIYLDPLDLMPKYIRTMIVE